MGRGTICLLVVGLANLLAASEIGLDSVPQSEIKEIEDEIAKGNVPPDYAPADKAKRGVAKLTNGDNPTFNHISTTSSAGASTVKATTANQSPYRYVYNNQYYPASPYISYIQSPQAAQIASQYSFQASPIAHYLQTPTQIQYVSSPSIATARYQTVNAKVAGSTASAGTGSTAAAQYQSVAPTQQLYISPQSLYQTQTSGSTTHSPSSATQYQPPPQIYYPQQPIVMLLVQPQAVPTALTYPFQNQQQHQQASYVLGQHPFLNLYNNHRFALPYTPNNQVTYLVPMAVQTTSAQAVKTGAADKTTSGIQTANSGVSYGVRSTKA